MKFILRFIGNKTCLILVFLSASLAMLDMLGIAVIFPFLKIFSNPAIIQKNKLLSYINLAFSFPSAQTFIIFFSAALICFFLLKFVGTYFFSKWRYGINAQIAQRLSDSLFKLLMGAKYGFLVKSSVSEMTGIINSHTIHGTLCLEAWVTIGTESLFLILLLISMLIISPLVTTISVAVLVLSSISIYLRIIKRTTQIGREQTDIHLKQYKFLYNVINGIKDIKIMGLEKECFDELALLNKRFSRIVQQFNAYQTLPRSIIELLIMIGFVAVCILTTLLNYDLTKITPFLGLVAISSIRIIPSYGKIIGSYNSYKYYQESLGLLSDLFESLTSNQHQVSRLRLPFEQSLRIEGLSFNYDSNLVLQNISLTIPKGKAVGIVGASGSGKTTFLDVLAGLKQAREGHAYLDGQSFDMFTTDALKHFIGYVPQNVTLVDESIAFNIAFEIELDQEKLARVSKMAKIHDFIMSLPDGYSTLVGENGMRLSGGQKQRIGIARALYRDPEILIFDEATSSLDTLTEKELTEEINTLSGKKTLIVVTHRLKTVERCNKIYVFDKGRILASGDHQDLLRSCEYYRALNQGVREEKLPC